MIGRGVVRAAVGLAAVGGLAAVDLSTGILGAMPAGGGEASPGEPETATATSRVPVERRTLTI